MDQTVLAVIPARGGSKRIPKKNVREVGGKPLIAHTIEQAAAADHLTEAVVSSDSEEIRRVAREHDGTVPFKRPADLATDEASTSAVVTHALDWYEDRGRTFDVVCLLHPTTPLRTAADIDGAMEKFRDAGALSLVTVSAYAHPPQLALQVDEDGYLRERYKPGVLFTDGYTRSQDLEELVRADGLVYLATTEAWAEFESFYTPETSYYEISPERALDIDEPWELELVDKML